MFNAVETSRARDAGTILLALDTNAAAFLGKHDFCMCELQTCKMRCGEILGGSLLIHPAATKHLHLQPFAAVFAFCAARPARHFSGKNRALRRVSRN
jgi:hypothetical protein